MHSQVQNLCDIESLIQNFQRFTVVALTMAMLAGHIHIRQEVHFHFDETFSLARLAAPAFNIEAETTCVIAALTRCRRLSEKFSNRREKPRVSRGIGAR